MVSSCSAFHSSTYPPLSSPPSEPLIPWACLPNMARANNTRGDSCQKLCFVSLMLTESHGIYISRSTGRSHPRHRKKNLGSANVSFWESRMQVCAAMGFDRRKKCRRVHFNLQISGVQRVEQIQTVCFSFFFPGVLWGLFRCHFQTALLNESNLVMNYLSRPLSHPVYWHRIFQKKWARQAVQEKSLWKANKRRHILRLVVPDHTSA